MSENGKASHLKGKRKKKVPPPACANPLFSKWLSQWRDEAAEKGLKSSHTYGKALKTLRLFPIPLATGKDCRLLQNFGDKICKMLDEKLAEHNMNLASQGLGCSNQPEDIIIQKPHSSGQLKYTKLANPQPDIVSTSCAGHRSDETNIHSISDSSDSDAEPRPPPKKRHNSGNTSRSREYVPAYRSGPYAIMLTLHRYMQQAGFIGYLGKTELCQAAQPQCDKSFLVPDPGSRYTAWSSMGTLIKKGLILKEKSPARYSLTDQGYELAGRLSLTETLQESISESTSCKGNTSTAVAGVSATTPSSQPTSSTAYSGLETSFESLPMSPHKTCHNISISPDPSPGWESLAVDVNEHIDGAETEYVPCYGSGSYALLTALFKLMQDPSFAGHLDKAQLCQAAQSSCDLSFSTPRPGSQSTAWSAMSTLVEKHLILETGTPARYSLTSSGFDLAEQLTLAETIRESSFCEPHASSSSTTATAAAATATADSPHSSTQHPHSSYLDLSFPPHSASLPRSPHTSSVPIANEDVVVLDDDDEDNDVCDVHFDDIDDYDQDIPLVTSLSPRMNHCLSPSPSNSPIQRGVIPNNPDTAANSLSLVPKVVEISDDDDGDGDKSDNHSNSNVCTKITEAKSSSVLCAAGKTTASNKYSNWSDSSDEDLPDLDLDKPLSERLLLKGNSIPNQLLTGSQNIEPLPLSINSTETATTSDASSFEKACGDSVSLEKQTSVRNNKEIKQKTQVSKQTKKKIDSFPNKNQVGIVSQGACNIELYPTQTEASLTTPMSFQPDQIPSQAQSPLVVDYSFAPGTFDIVLCIDNREFYGRKSNSKTLLPELMKAGIQCDLRLLHVGDLLWVARERLVHNYIGPGRRLGRELVLNTIVERKRMDDLVSSMTDGRMKEQKFRMKQSGLQDLIILIEEHGSIQNFSLSEERIRQSIANSQMIDGFKVKQCAGPADAVVYLAALTRALHRLYSNKTLHAVSVDQLRGRGRRPNVRDSQHYLMPFDTFNEASVKQKDPTVQELFMRQLCQVPGVSGSKARGITAVYPTLSCLMERLHACADAKEKEKLLVNIQWQVKAGSRNIGIAVSRLIAMMYTQQGSLS